jgi:hypothetical protein
MGKEEPSFRFTLVSESGRRMGKEERYPPPLGFKRGFAIANEGEGGKRAKLADSSAKEKAQARVPSVYIHIHYSFVAIFSSVHGRWQNLPEKIFSWLCLCCG